MEYLIPTAEEVKDWIQSMLRHSLRVESYLHRLGINTPDPERPHDLVGPGNKFEWGVMRGYAMQNRPGIDYDKCVLPSIMHHRQQYHHRMWNEPDPSDVMKRNPLASEIDMMVGAIDTLCSLREPRVYQGGVHSWEEIDVILQKNKPHKQEWMKRMAIEMRKVQELDFSEVNVPVYILPIFMPEHIKRRIIVRTSETFHSLFGEGRLYPEWK